MSLRTVFTCNRCANEGTPNDPTGQKLPHLWGRVAMYESNRGHADLFVKRDLCATCLREVLAFLNRDRSQ